jgi:BlaI family transcriptional regulator, penicillinase repressor
MKALWARAPAAARDIVATLAPKTHWSAKTILTLVRRLVGKGAVGFTRDVRVNLYFPKVTERECVKAETRSFLKRVFGGSLQPMLAHFVQESELSERDVAELRRILDESRPKPAGERPRPRKARS